jgi:hypothetical protein
MLPKVKVKYASLDAEMSPVMATKYCIESEAFLLDLTMLSGWPVRRAQARTTSPALFRRNSGPGLALIFSKLSSFSSHPHTQIFIASSSISILKMSRRTLGYAALGAAGVGGYYLYSAGGDPKVAKQEIKREPINLVPDQSS